MKEHRSPRTHQPFVRKWWQWNTRRAPLRPVARSRLPFVHRMCSDGNSLPSDAPVVASCTRTFEPGLRCVRRWCCAWKSLMCTTLESTTFCASMCTRTHWLPASHAWHPWSKCDGQRKKRCCCCCCCCDVAGAANRSSRKSVAGFFRAAGAGAGGGALGVLMAIPAKMSSVVVVGAGRGGALSVPSVGVAVVPAPAMDVPRFLSFVLSRWLRSRTFMPSPIPTPNMPPLSLPFCDRPSLLSDGDHDMPCLLSGWAKTAAWVGALASGALVGSPIIVSTLSALSFSVVCTTLTFFCISSGFSAKYSSTSATLPFASTSTQHSAFSRCCHGPDTTR
eukprot:PhM_4_TR11664/c1_g1_i2/m.64181